MSLASRMLLNPQDGLGLQGQPGSRRKRTKLNSPQNPLQLAGFLQEPTWPPHPYPVGQARGEGQCVLRGLLGANKGRGLHSCQGQGTYALSGSPVQVLGGGWLVGSPQGAGQGGQPPQTTTHEGKDTGVWG